MKTIKTVFTALALSTALILGSVPAQAQVESVCITQEQNAAEALVHGFELSVVIEDVEAFKDYLIAVGRVSPNNRPHMSFDLAEVYTHADTDGYVVVLYKDGCVQAMFREASFIIDGFLGDDADV